MHQREAWISGMHFAAGYFILRVMEEGTTAGIDALNSKQKTIIGGVVLILVIAAIAAYLFYPNNTPESEIDYASVTAPGENLPQTNPFEKSTNPFTDYKNPFE